MSSITDISPKACSAADIIDRLLRDDRRLLLFGPPGVGKSTLAADLARALDATGRHCWCISADPGSPGFGVPGAVSLGQWHAGGWQVQLSEALCTLDAGRFRLPLVSAVRFLAQTSLDGVVLIDGPGVVRGVAGRELLLGLVEAAEVDAVVAITASDRPVPLINELQSLSAELVVIQAAEQARRPGKRIRAKNRTAQWDTYLEEAREHTIDLARLNLIGTPPPVEITSSWIGRQLALLQQGHTQTMGEVLTLQGTRLTLRTPVETVSPDCVLLRDAQRSVDGLLETAEPFAAERFHYIPPPDIAPHAGENGGPRIVGRVGAVDVTLVNGVFGDPLLHVRLRHQARSLLFDLGNGGRLPARIAHQVSDVFISHAHMDHIGGFLWLLRSRIDGYPPCRLYGPPGLAQHIEGFIKGILWDRVGERGPTFEVTEFHGEFLRRFRLKAGHPACEALADLEATEGILLTEPGFHIRAVLLDHHTPVLAYALEPDQEIKVRKDRLLARGLAPGPWLGDLKQCLLAGNNDVIIQLPDGSAASAGTLGVELVLISPGKRLVYATDLADTTDNRERLVALAKQAHTLFCEATFTEEDAEHAARNGHLTARACGEIAAAAGVARLLPFHLSRRYADNPQQLYDELQAACGCVVIPPSMAVFEPPSMAVGSQGMLEIG